MTQHSENLALPGYDTGQGISPQAWKPWRGTLEDLTGEGR